ncbi:MAG TPA: tRNA 2-thiouridine(34) synthase MnmA [Actinomycetota bacterium]|nr:tRNA 2-thiouridine(34) synthase MnmA [Actinomycetota bacterium]
MSKKAVVAMSGGVDSSVAAALLVEQGYDVTGVMLKLWRGEAENNNSGCCNLGAAEDARRVADVLGIPFYVFNFAEDFERSVIADFHATYAAGRTPNPCVRCNQWIKFETLLDRARQLGADLLATGHYARVIKDGDRYALKRGVDKSKDQSYVLWMLTQDELAHVAFPVGDQVKSRTRALAAQLGLRTAAKPDSQEICFVRNGDVGAYLDQHVGRKPGEIVDADGTVLGRHDGIGRFTIGQRKGLGISVGMPRFVSHIDAVGGRVTVGSRADLAVAAFSAEELHLVDADLPPGSGIFIQHRAHGEVNPGEVVARGRDRIEIEFDTSVEAVAPGQSAAFYSTDDPDLLLGGGIISETASAVRTRGVVAS